MSMDIKDEYSHIKNEINQKIELHNSLLTFTITTTVLILSYGISEQEPLLFLVPFFIIIPMSIRIKYYKGAMSKLAAYLIVFLESEDNQFNWETRNEKLIESDSINRKYNNPLVELHSYECLILCIACYILFLIYYFNDYQFNIWSCLVALLPVILIIWEYLITKGMNEISAKDWKYKWQCIKEKEDSK